MDALSLRLVSLSQKASVFCLSDSRVNIQGEGERESIWPWANMGALTEGFA